MPHGNIADWSGEVQSPQESYDIHWELWYVQPHTPSCACVDFTVEHGMRGAHVAQALANAWNAKYVGTMPASASNGEVDFAGHVDRMEFKLLNPPAGTTIATEVQYSSVNVVPGVSVSRK